MFPQDSQILIVDDMSSALELLKAHLKELGLTQLLEARNGAEAVQLIKDSYSVGLPVDLVISDWHMPEMTGLDLLKWVRSSGQASRLPFILLTSEGEATQILLAVQAGTSDYIVKPVTLEVLKKKLETVWLRQSKKGK